MRKRSSDVRINNTDIWLPKSQAYSNAQAVYREFSGTRNMPDILTRLSLVCRGDYEPSAALSYLSAEMASRLMDWYYLIDTDGSITERTTSKGIIATHMIAPEVFSDGEVMGEIVEPFEGHEILPRLYEEHTKAIATRKETWN